jgi:hypothetical protein
MKIATRRGGDFFAREGRDLRVSELFLGGSIPLRLTDILARGCGFA